jgi:hypothetical protein
MTNYGKYQVQVHLHDINQSNRKCPNIWVGWAKSITVTRGIFILSLGTTPAADVKKKRMKHLMGLHIDYKC